MSFVNAHYPAYITDLGYSQVLVGAVGPLVGVGSILGAISFGRLSDSFGRRNVLGVCYGLRALGYGILVLPLIGLGISQSVPGIVVATIIIGLSWTSVMSGTAAVTADHFGVRRLTSVYSGIVTISPVAAFLGLWLAGRIYDETARRSADGIGNYDIVLWINFILPMIATVVVFLIRGRGRYAPKPAEVSGSATHTEA